MAKDKSKLATVMGNTPSKCSVALVCLALTLAIVAVYSQMNHHGFISNFDDDLYITDNSHVKSGLTWNGIKWAFTTTHAYNWHPLTWISHMLDCHLFALHPGSHHLMNLLFHIANTMLLALILKRMTGDFWPSVFVAAAFALHPLHVESVAWASERKDTLSTFFWMLTMWAYIRYVEHPTVKRYLATLLFLAIGLLAKQMLVTLPFVLLLLDYWPLRRFPLKTSGCCNSKRDATVAGLRRCILEKLPLLVLSVAASITVYLVQQHTGVVKSTLDCPVIYRVENALLAYIRYIGKMFWPFNLAIFYPHLGGSLPAWRVAAAALTLVGITAAVIYMARQCPYLVVGWLWYLGTLIPVIGLVQVGMQALADRYTYIPLIGLFIIIAWASRDLLTRFRFRKAILSLSAVASLSVLALITYFQLAHWRNDITLYTHAAQVVPDNWWAHQMLGHSFSCKGDLPKAMQHYKTSLQIRPGNAFVCTELGAMLFEQAKLDEAVDYLAKALQIKPDYPKAHACIGIVMGEQGDYDKALEHLNEALKIDSQSVEVHINIGTVFARQGKYDQAVKHLRQALRLQPNHPGAMRNLTRVLQEQQRLSRATGKDEAPPLKSDDTAELLAMGNAMAQQGKYEAAVYCYRRFLESKPDSVIVLNNLAWLLAMSEDPKLRNAIDAVEYAERACELAEPNQPTYRDTLAVAYAAAGNFAKAIEMAEQALKLAEAVGESDLAAQIQERLQLYKSGQPYRKK